MGSKDKIVRREEMTRRTILDTALNMIEDKGCDCISMRKLADEIGYTAPVIYTYYKNKESIYLDLAQKGYLLLVNDIKIAREKEETAVLQIESMWLAYWNFAREHREIYQLMFGINTVCFPKEQNVIDSEIIYQLYLPVISGLFNKTKVDENEVRKKFLTFWSLVHGLIAINMVSKFIGEETSLKILLDGIRIITGAVNDPM